MLENPLPDTGFGPAAEAAVHVLPVTQAFRQIPPGDTGTVAIQHSLDKQPIVRRRAPHMPFSPGQRILDPIPLVIAQSVTMHRSASPKADRL